MKRTVESLEDVIAAAADLFVEAVRAQVDELIEARIPPARTVPEDRVLLTAGDVSIMTGFTESTLANWRASGSGPRYVKIGSAVRYRIEDFEEWLSASTGRVGKPQER